MYVTNKLSDLLGNKNFEEPKEVRTIKDFVRKRLNANVSVTMQQHQIIIGVNSSALAGALRMHLHDLQKLCATDKKLLIRIT